MTARFWMAAAGGVVTASVVLGAQAMSPWQDVIRNLRHPNPETRLAAVRKLDDGGYAPAAEAVAPLIVDPDDRVQSAAIDAELTFFLTERLSSTRVMGIGNSKSRAQQAFDEGPLIRQASPAPAVLIDKLIAAMRDENARVRFDAIHALGFIAQTLTPAQVTALADGLDHYDPVMRTATARVMGRLRVTGAGDKLLAALGDSSPNVRFYAVEALGFVRETRALAPLRDLVLRGRGDDVANGLLALARVGSADDLTLFRDHLTDKSAAMRRAAVEGLGRLRDQPSQAAIDQMFKTDPSADVKLAAAFALQLLGETQSHIIASMLIVPEQAPAARDYLFEIGHDALPGIQAALQVATDSRHRADLIQAAGYVGHADDAAALEPFLKDRDERVVRAATVAITRLRQ